MKSSRKTTFYSPTTKPTFTRQSPPKTIDVNTYLPSPSIVRHVHVTKMDLTDKASIDIPELIFERLYGTSSASFWLDSAAAGAQAELPGHDMGVPVHAAGGSSVVSPEDSQLADVQASSTRFDSTKGLVEKEEGKDERKRKPKLANVSHHPRLSIFGSMDSGRHVSPSSPTQQLDTIVKYHGQNILLTRRVDGSVDQTYQNIFEHIDQQLTRERTEVSISVALAGDFDPAILKSLKSKTEANALPNASDSRGAGTMGLPEGALPFNISRAMFGFIGYEARHEAAHILHSVSGESITPPTWMPSSSGGVSGGSRNSDVVEGGAVQQDGETKMRPQVGVGGGDADQSLTASLSSPLPLLSHAPNTIGRYNLSRTKDIDFSPINSSPSLNQSLPHPLALFFNPSAYVVFDHGTSQLYIVSMAEQDLLSSSSSSSATSSLISSISPPPPEGNKAAICRSEIERHVQSMAQQRGSEFQEAIRAALLSGAVIEETSDSDDRLDFIEKGILHASVEGRRRCQDDILAIKHGPASSAGHSDPDQNPHTDTLLRNQLNSQHHEKQQNASPSSTADCPRGILRTTQSQSQYRASIDRCLEYIRAGESYELCLTLQARGRAKEGDAGSPLLLHKSLRRRNPAPYGAFFHYDPNRLGGTSHAGNSRSYVFLSENTNTLSIINYLKLGSNLIRILIQF